MASRPRFLSRRALLKIAAASTLAPFALSPYGRAELEALSMALFTDKGKRKRFFKVAADLWEVFEDGVDIVAAREPKVDIQIGPGVLAEAISLSGAALISNINCFNDVGKEIGGKRTENCVNACAVVSAEAAREIAGTPKVITVDMFRVKWGATRDFYKAARCQIPDPGGSAPSGPADGPGIMAFGC